MSNYTQRHNPYGTGAFSKIWTLQKPDSEGDYLRKALIYRMSVYACRKGKMLPTAINNPINIERPLAFLL
jgi:hypothetical protein